MFDALRSDLEAQNAVGLLIAAQLGASPSELTLIVRSATINATTGEVIPVHQYLVNAVGVVEHKLILGLFNQVGYANDHPLLYHHNAPGVKIFITSPAPDADELLWAIDEAYGEVFGRWRELNADLNQRVDPRAILQNGKGALATVPAPFAPIIDKLLTEQGVGHQVIMTDPKIGGCVLLAFDDSLVIARSFNVQPFDSPLSDSSGVQAS